MRVQSRGGHQSSYSRTERIPWGAGSVDRSPAPFKSHPTYHARVREHEIIGGFLRLAVANSPTVPECAGPGPRSPGATQSNVGTRIIYPLWPSPFLCMPVEVTYGDTPT